MRVVSKRGPATGKDSPAAVAMGFFDGLHRGHAAVIGAARDYAAAQGLRLAVFTFRQGPKLRGKSRLLGAREKHRQLAALGVQTCYQPPFSSFAGLSPQDFFTQMLLQEYNAKALFCGQDFAFGAQRAGTVALLGGLCAKAGVALQAVPLAVYNGKAISSSRIRAALAAGDIPLANAMLGYPYEIDFAVRHGKQLGSKLGFPTINQRFPAGLQAPAYGVYVTQVFAEDQWWPSVTGYGTRPTVDNGAPSCETFIPGFSGNLYGRHVRVRFYKKIANPQKFASFEQLAQAVQSWGAAALAYFEDFIPFPN